MKSSLEILEYDKLKQIIEKYIQTRYGKKALSELKPDFNIEKAKSNFDRLNEFFDFFYKWGSITIDDIYISDIIKDAFSGTLIEKELLQIGNFLSTLDNIEEYFKEHKSELCEKYIAFDIPTELLYEINKTIDEHGYIKDSATPYLYDLRTRIKQLKEEITRSLKNTIHSRIREVISDTAIFMKRSRYTLLMKPNFKEYIKGRIIDISKSGGFFVEPDSIYELNNNLEELIAKEESEKRKILMRITDMVRKNSSRLIYNEKKLGKIDLEIAKFEYAKNFEQPEIVFTNKHVLFAKKAKHPILADINKETKSVDIDLKSDTKLIITGPNTGGKTVFLKTAGLLVLSVFSNIPPMAMYIEIGNFDSIFAIIGDEQDILESLSSFSAKMIALKNIYERLSNNSFVLLDEIGGGTSPDEGEAVAFSVIENLKDKCVFIATTHFKRLAYILSSMGYPTAAFEFDKKNLKPTYNLRYSYVGQSYATEILKTLNLQKEIVDKAVEFYKNNETNFSKLEKELEKKLKELDKEKEQTEKMKKLYETLSEQTKKEKAEALSEIEQERALYKRNYEELVERLKKEINKLLKEKNISKAHRFINEINRKTKDSFDSKEMRKKNATFFVGEYVNFRGMTGKIIDIKGTKATVEIDGKIINTDISLLSKEEKREQKQLTFVKSQNRLSSLEINLIGKRRDDAQIELMKFLDGAIVSSVKNVRIVHGIGTGILRSMVCETLKNHPYIKSFHPAHPNEGGDGATIAEFK